MSALRRPVNLDGTVVPAKSSTPCDRPPRPQTDRVDRADPRLKQLGNNHEALLVGQAPTTALEAPCCCDCGSSCPTSRARLAG
jgi:hypothetical protein